MSFATALSLKGGLKIGLSQGQDSKKRTFESEGKSMANYVADEINHRERSEAKLTTRKPFLNDLDDINSPSTPKKEDSRANAHSHPLNLYVFQGLHTFSANPTQNRLTL